MKTSTVLSVSLLVVLSLAGAACVARWIFVTHYAQSEYDRVPSWKYQSSRLKHKTGWELRVSAKGSGLIIEGVASYPREAASHMMPVALPLADVVDGGYRKRKIVGMGYYAFNGCPFLASVVIPDGVTSIGCFAFSGCFGLTNVVLPSSVTSIDLYSFSRCSRLPDIAIPEGVTRIGEQAFEGCAVLTNISVAAGNPAYCSIDGVLFNRDGTLLIRCPEGKTGTYEISSSVTNIGEQAFYKCVGLTAISVAADNPAYCSVDGVMFSKDKTLLVQFPAGRSGMYEIPDHVTSIGNHAFRGCGGLTNVVIPDSVRRIGHGAFSQCVHLTDAVIPNSVAEINSSMFDYCTGLTNVVIPAGVTYIESHAFSRCISLANVVIPDSVTHIGVQAFLGCRGLMDVSIGAGVTRILLDAFAGCAGLTNISIAAGNPAYCSVDGAMFSKDRTLLIQYPAKKKGAYDIPFGVTRIGDEAFRDCDELTHVVIPDSVRHVGVMAFSGCSSLTNVVVPDSVIRMDDWAFRGCTNLVNRAELLQRKRYWRR